jgi:hypothetical protein
VSRRFLDEFFCSGRAEGAAAIDGDAAQIVVLSAVAIERRIRRRRQLRRINVRIVALRLQTCGVALPRNNVDKAL